eukprot:4537689-Prymnesium_polylepis.1
MRLCAPGLPTARPTPHTLLPLASPAPPAPLAPRWCRAAPGLRALLPSSARAASSLCDGRPSPPSNGSAAARHAARPRRIFSGEPGAARAALSWVVKCVKMGATPGCCASGFDRGPAGPPAASLKALTSSASVPYDVADDCDVTST